MKHKVRLIIDGKEIYETVHAGDYQQAEHTARARNPYATVASVNADFTPDNSFGNRRSQVTFSSASNNYQGMSLSNSDLVGIFVLIIICIGLGAAFAYLPIVLSTFFGYQGAKNALIFAKEENVSNDEMLNVKPLPSFVDEQNISKEDKKISKRSKNNFLSNATIFIISTMIFGSLGYAGGNFLEKRYWPEQAQSSREFYKDIIKAFNE